MIKIAYFFLSYIMKITIGLVYYKVFVSLVLSCVSIAGFAAKDPTKVTLNLSTCTNHTLHVSLQIPGSKAQKHRFILPTNVPGAISEMKTGLLIDNFQPKTAEGKLLKFARVSLNEFDIVSEGKLFSIDYDIHDSWHYADKKLMLPQVGTSFDPGVLFLLNMHAVVGYVQGFEEYPYRVAITKPDTLFAASNLEISTFGGVDFIDIPGGYLQLIDNPILYSKEKPLSFIIGTTKFKLGFYSESKTPKQSDILAYLKKVSEAALQFCRTFNTKQYTFLITFVLPDSDPFKTDEVYGAIEHSASSLFYFPISGNEYKTERDIMFTAAHELMHLYGPLQLQTDLTSRINLRAKNPSANLWMYEGFTEYLSLLMLYQQDLITENEFITEIRNKINLASYAENISLEDASKMYYMDGNEDMYRMFYNKGALTAMMLDLRLLKLSKGNLNLKKLLQDILNTSKQNYVLKDERVIEELAQYSYPEVKDFLVSHVKDTLTIDINKDLESIGWKYTDSKIDTVNMYVNAVYRYTKASKEYFLTNISFDQMGFQEKDVLVTINKKRVTRDNLNTLLDKVSDVNFKKKVVFKVRRGNELVELTGPPLMVTKNQKNLISIEKKIDIEKKSLRDVFRSGKPSGGQTYKILN